MMNKLIIFVCLAVTLAISSMAAAHDVVIPPWRGANGSTYQAWEFSTADLMPAPDVVYNDYGTPQLKVTPFGDWIPDPGAWALSGEIDILIPNYPQIRPEKWIQIQLTWKAADNDPFLPNVPLVGLVSDPMFDGMNMGPVATNDAGQDWVTSIYNITIWPNPFEEWIAIKGDILVDEVVIDTICIPEPATICLLGLGTLTMLRKRRV